MSAFVKLVEKVSPVKTQRKCCTVGCEARRSRRGSERREHNSSAKPRVGVSMMAANLTTLYYDTNVLDNVPNQSAINFVSRIGFDRIGADCHLLPSDELARRPSLLVLYSYSAHYGHVNDCN
ncbi:hypothetical protein J6590_033711 [Homalodisca vitripennis]|nr:hypothetical protein J6590_033711 [Homalodisca vitripennis]